MDMLIDALFPGALRRLLGEPGRSRGVHPRFREAVDEFARHAPGPDVQAP